MDDYRAHVYALTHGDPPKRSCLRGSEDKWNGYLLGVEEAIRASESWHDERLRGAVEDRDALLGFVRNFASWQTTADLNRLGREARLLIDTIDGGR